MLFLFFCCFIVDFSMQYNLTKCIPITKRYIYYVIRQQCIQITNKGV